MVSVIRLEKELSKKKIAKILKKYHQKVLLVSKRDLSLNNYIVVKNIKQAIFFLEKGKNVNFVYKKISTYFSLIKKLEIKEIRIIKKVKNKTKKVDFLTFDQMEILQLYFESIHNQELQISKRNKANIIIDFKRSTYLITLYDKIKDFHSIYCYGTCILIKGTINKERIMELINNLNISFKSIKFEKGYMKLKCKHRFKVLDLIFNEVKK